MMTQPAEPHEMYVTGFHRDSSKGVFLVTFSTAFIVSSNVVCDGMLAVDGTFNCFIGGFPIIVTAEVRRNNKSKIRSISLASSESAECVELALIHSLGSSNRAFGYTVSDAGLAIFSALKRVLPGCRHLMCWYHMRTAQFDLKQSTFAAQFFSVLEKLFSVLLEKNQYSKNRQPKITCV